MHLGSTLTLFLGPPMSWNFMGNDSKHQERQADMNDADADDEEDEVE